MQMVILLLLLSILMVKVDASYGSDQTEFRRLLSKLVQDQQCHVEVSANAEQDLLLVQELVTRIPITVKRLRPIFNYDFKVCVLHMIFLSSTDDADLIRYNQKERL